MEDNFFHGTYRRKTQIFQTNFFVNSTKHLEGGEEGREGTVENAILSQRGVLKRSFFDFCLFACLFCLISMSKYKVFLFVF